MASDNILPLTGIRGIIAQKMSESLQKTAQLSFFCDIDASALVEARNRWKASGLKLGYEDLIIAALTSALHDFPLFNAVETERGAEPQDQFHVGCAIALPGALVAPAIFDVGSLSLADIAEQIGVSQVQVSRLLRASLSRMRDAVADPVGTGAL